MVYKQLINGLKYEKLSEEQLYDLSQWELVDIILAYRNELLRKEQECEELRGVIRKDICSHYVLGECSQNHHNNCVGRNQCIKDLEQECERLENENKRLVGELANPIFDSFEELDQLKAENDELKEIIQLHDNDNNALLSEVEDGLVEYYRRYKDCLTEIKEIAEQYEATPNLECKQLCCTEILQKISEVEDEN